MGTIRLALLIEPTAKSPRLLPTLDRLVRNSHKYRQLKMLAILATGLNTSVKRRGER